MAHHPNRGRRVRAALATALGLWTAACASRQAAPGAGAALQDELAEVLVAHHAYEPALPLLQKRVAERPDDARAHLMLGVVLRDRGLLTQAQQEIAAAWHLSPDDPDAAAALGVCFDQQHDGAQAETWHRRAIALAPQRADFYNNLGFSFSLAGRYEDAVRAYEDALQRDPGLHRVFNNLGFAQARLGQFDAALRAFQQGGSKTGAFVNLGLAYELAGDLQAARSFYEEALRVDRKSALARRNLDALLAKQAPPSALSLDVAAPRGAAPTSPENVP